MNQLHSSKLSYRAEIDGLRAIAVISVILYHAKMVLFGKDWFEGGFIGVDIFFVISGYLITRIILFELQTSGSLDFLNFYERRARRILPMLFVVIFVSIPVAWQLLLPSDFVEYANSILASLFFSSNFFFYVSTTEYGAENALLEPFLHTWSLAVEEQFYVVFPFLAIIAFRFFRRHFLAMVFVLSVLSLLFAALMQIRNPDLNFYLPFSRFWELAVGSMLAYRELNVKISSKGIAAKILPLLGLYLIVHSILVFDGETPHPGFYTLLPIAGVAFVIGFASKDDLVGKLLGSKPFVWVGLVSYSAYLWHFPIFAFSRHHSLSHSNYDKVEWIALTFILSILSYIFIERHFRDSHKTGRKMFVTVIVSAFALALAISFLIRERVIVNPEKILVGKLLDYGAFRKEHNGYEASLDYSVPKNGKSNILIVGNSHGEDLLKALRFSYLTKDFNINLTSPARRPGDINYQVQCFWHYLNNGDSTCENVEYNPNLSAQYGSADIIVFATRWFDADMTALSLSIPKVLNDGKKVIVVGNTPQSETFGEKRLNRFDRFLFESKGMHLPSAARLRDIEAQFYQDYLHKQGKINDQLSTIVDSFSNPDVVFRERSDFMCDEDKKTCFMYFPQEKVKVLWDYGHTTTDGARILGRLISERQWLSDFIQ